MILRVENAAFAYRGQKPLFRNVSFSVASGEVLAVLGPNGAGKTTLLRAMTGMLPFAEGRTTLDGRDVRTMSARALWQRIAYVPQARTAAAPFTVLESVLLGRSGRIPLFGAPAAADVAAAEATLDSLGIGPLRDKRCRELSGGEMQMVLIARALAADPAVLILDEPESNLDFRNQLLVLDTVSRLAREGVACIFNTHYPDHALRRADRALLLHHGEAAVGPAAGIVTEAAIARAFGVRAAVGGIETAETTVPGVVALSVLDPSKAPTAAPDVRVLAAVSVILTDAADAAAVNAVLHAHRGQIRGRMGLPVREYGLSVIHLTADGTRAELGALTDALSRLPGVRVKAAKMPLSPDDPEA